MIQYNQYIRYILRHHLELRGLKGGIFAFGLASSRYVEYSIALSWLISEQPTKKDLILELGCGHSIMPSLWKKIGLSVVAVDISLRAVNYQANVGNQIEGGYLHVCLADGKNLPFKDGSFRFCVAISTIEHFPSNGDAQAVQEMARVLRPKGLMILSMPFSQKFKQTDDYFALIPLVWRRLLGHRFLKVLFRKFDVNRESNYFEHTYNFKTLERLVKPSGLVIEDYKIFAGDLIHQTIHDRLVPMGTITPLDFLLAKKCTKIGAVKQEGGIIVKLRKSVK